ncbi:MAG: hypothetical protein EBS77_08830 [Gammaproteobacteria bacterium]|nr:hypothetical protein [Gammaproteobacteria bacterium]
MQWKPGVRRETEQVLWPIAITLVFTAGALLIPPPLVVGSGNWGGHALSYAVVAVVLTRRAVYPLPAIILGLIALGAVLELIQPKVGRIGSVSDALANGVGVLFGCAIGCFSRRLRA